MNSNRASALILAISLTIFASGCRKKVGAVPPPPAPVREAEKTPPRVEKPVITSFTAEPTSIERGQASTLKWTVTGADSITINNGVGTVPASGERAVFPNNTTTYALSATNSGGSSSESVTVNVTVPQPKPAEAPPSAPTVTFDMAISQRLSDAFFDYDKYDLREDARSALTKDADTLKSLLTDYPSGTVLIEGHCDERGSAEYNLGLGDRRATATRDFLVQLGVSADRLKTVSYGKEKPQCTESTEACWQKNRRTHFSGQ